MADAIAGRLPHLSDGRCPPGRCCATFKSAPGGFVIPGRALHRQTIDKTKGPVFRQGPSFCLMPGSSLLSHGETPHYHRRYGVSLLSSAWGQVGPPRYGRQANSWCSKRIFYPDAALAALANVSHILLYAPSFPSLAALPQRKILRFHKSGIRLKIVSQSAKTASAL